MANIESKNLLVAVKAYSRGNPLPLDASEVYDSLAAAQAYAGEANAYAGQTIKVLVDGEYKSYVLQPSDSGLILKEVSAVQPEDLKKYVQVVEALPTTGEKDIVYIVGTTGSIWNDTDKKYEVIFKDLTSDLEAIEKSIEDGLADTQTTIEGIEKDIEQNKSDIAQNKSDIAQNTTDISTNAESIKGIEENIDTIEGNISDINDALALKANIENPIFVGTVKVKADATTPDEDAEEVAVKSYVEGLIASIHSNSPKLVNSSTPLPTTKYKAGQSWRVGEAGTYAGQVCEIGDVIICLNDYKADTASNDDFIVIQANIDGAVTSSADAVTDASIVVFDGVTGKVIKSSEVSLASLNTVIANSHTHDNKEELDTYDKTQSELLATALEAAEGKISDFNTNTIQPIAEDVAKKANAADVYTKDEADDLLDAKANASDVYTKDEIDNNIIQPITEDVAKKANANDVYTKDEANDLLDAKANATDVYTTTEIDSKVQVIEGNLNTKVATADFNTKIGDLGDKSVKDYVESAVSDASGEVTDYVDSKLGDITDAEGNVQTVKEYVDAGLAEKANKATTLAGYGIADAYTKTEVDSKVSADIASAKTELTTEINKKAAQTDFDELSGKVNILIGDDENKSVKTIVSTEVAKIINDNDASDIDTLEEIAAWIANHPESVAEINAAITKIQNQLKGIDEGEGTVKTYIDNKVANIDLTPYATTDALAAGVAEAKSYVDTQLTAALTIVRF